MANGSYHHLKLNELADNIETSWQALYTDKHFCDVILACDDQQLEVHKVVISFFSPVLKDILKENQTKDALIYLVGVKFKDLENLVKFVYKSEVYIAENNLESFLKMAEDFKIKGLSQGYINEDGSHQNTSFTKRLKRRKSKNTDNKANPNNKIKQEFSFDKDKEFKFVDVNDSIIQNNNDSQDVISVEDVKDKVKIVLKDDLEDKNEFNALSKEFQGRFSVEKDYILLKENKGYNSYGDKEEVNKESQDYNSYKDKVMESNVSNQETDEHAVKQVSFYNNKKRSYKCKECDVILPSRREFQRHNLSSFHFPCDKCDYHGRDTYTIRLHIKSIHEKLSHYCDHCNYRGRDMYKIKEHIKSAHEGVRYYCNQCDFEAAQKGNVTQHKKAVHEGLRQSCSECDYKTSHSGTLNRHVKAKHTKSS